MPYNDKKYQSTGEETLADANEQTQAESKSSAKSGSKNVQEFEVLSVERRGEKFALQLRGELVVTPSDDEREKYLNTAVGSRLKLDVKPVK